jgi:ubiquinone/menaquinone biosynthesis C-methylase UbiE
MNPNKALWEKGDFTEISSMMRESGEALVQSFGVTPPLRVMDLGCGDGTTAVPLAQLGVDVTGIDISTPLVAAGKKRAADLGLSNLTFQEGDACNLEGIPNDSFDLSISFFGAMFAPKPFDVAREMVRVTKPGGRIIMGNWIPNDPTSFVSDVLKISSAFTPPPPEGFISPMSWGVQSHIVERFGAAGIAADKISMVKDVFRFTAADKTPAQLIDIFRNFYGPTMNAFEAAEKNGRTDELYGQLVAVAEAHNTNTSGGVTIGSTFMRVTASV